MGGVKVNHLSEVEGPNGSIPGLYGAGEIMGGVHGKNRLGGNSLLDCVVYGRVAGREVMKYISANKAGDMPNITGPLTPSDTESFTSGGTSHILKAERANPSFDTKLLTNHLDGGKKMTAKRKFIMTSIVNTDVSGIPDMESDELLAS